MADKVKTLDVQTREENKKIIKQLVKEGKLPELRALTRTERKELDATGLNWLKTTGKETRNPLDVQEQCADWIIDTIFSDFDFSGVDNNICMEFATICYLMTYGASLAEKN